MYHEDDLAPISALQHIEFCERRAELIYLEGLWDENEYTARGQVEHQHAHTVGTEARGSVLVVRGSRIRSLSIGVTGQAGVVEYNRCDQGDSPVGVRLINREDPWRSLPVEYKSRDSRERERGYGFASLCAGAAACPSSARWLKRIPTLTLAMPNNHLAL